MFDDCKAKVKEVALAMNQLSQSHVFCSLLGKQLLETRIALRIYEDMEISFPFIEAQRAWILQSVD